MSQNNVMNRIQVERMPVNSREYCLSNVTSCGFDFLNSASSEDSNEQEIIQKSREFLISLNNYQLTLNKTSIIKETCQREIENYGKLEENINIQINQIKNNIQELKQKLNIANEIRDHRMEYETLAKQIEEFPSRLETKKSVEELDEEIKQLEEKKKELSETLNRRKNQFLLLMRTIHDLKYDLGSDEIPYEQNSNENQMEIE